MQILYYDCFSGISGDMNLGAMIDLGIDASYVISELQKLNLSGYTISFTKDQRKGITGTRANILIEHEHGHQHNHETHVHGRNLSDIKLLIEKSSLDNEVKKMSIKIFTKIGEAEAHVHGKHINEIHFHEVGAVDSIVDIVGAAICINYLKPDQIIASPVELGGGIVTCAHGTFPVPAPATFEILKNKPVKLGAVQVETTTPTGAAILATLVTQFIENPKLTIKRIGYGIGFRDNAVPNVLRVCLAESIAVAESEEQQAMIIECNIDDMNPELYEYVMDKLFEAGADDVWFQSIVMKKTRPAIKISVLCQNFKTNILENILLTETSTLGLRKHHVQKTILKRSWLVLETKWGQVRVKQGYWDNKIIKSKPEYEDCLKISNENQIPIFDVYKEIEGLLKT
jgi:pyridinium-3,5-bisthiocarboxylic acid mononucleotide nickel chelatase